MMRSPIAAFAVAAFLASGVVGLASASARITKLVVSNSSTAAGAAEVFPPGTTDLFVIFDYVGASGEEIAVALDGPGLPDLYSSPAKSYNGDGSDAVHIPGSSVYQSLVGLVEQEALEVQANVQKALVSSQGVHGYLEWIPGSVQTIRITLGLLETLEGSLSQSQLMQMEEVDAAITELSGLAANALSLPMDDVTGKQEIAKQMTAPAESAVDNAQALLASAEAVTEIAFPETGLDMEGYTVQVEVRGNPSISTEFAVAGDGTPSNTAPAEPSDTPTREGSDAVRQPTSTPRPGSGSELGTGATAAAATPGRPGDSEGPDPSSASSQAGGAAGQDELTVLHSQTATPRTSRAATAQASGAQPQVALGQQPPTAESMSRPAQAGAGDGNAPVAGATWTAAAPLARAPSGPASGAVPAPETGPAGTSGPNPLVLGAGAVALVFIALWLRRQM